MTKATGKSQRKSVGKPKQIVLHPKEKNGWNFMVAGLLVVLTAGAMVYLTPRSEPQYHRLGNYLTGIGLAVFIAGRFIRAKGRRLREKGETA
jgi:hypothetical protein